MSFIEGKLIDDGQLQCVTDAPETAVLCNGWTTDASGQALIEDVTEDAIRSDAQKVNGLCFSSNGALYVAIAEPENPIYVNGFSLRADGAVYASEDPAEDDDTYVNGFVFSPAGELRIEVA